MTNVNDNKGDLKSLLTKRTSIKGRITKFKNYVNDLSKKEVLTAIEISE